MTIKKLFFYFLLATIFLMGNSCSNTNKYKSIVYLADSVKESQKVVTVYEHVLQVGDRIQILVTALNPMAAQAFNISPSISALGGSEVTQSSSGIANSGYLIERDGTIQFPQLGRINVAGMTTVSLGKLIQDKLLQYLKEPVVLVNISNFRVNILGEVGHPGSITVPDGKITILQAISQSGDLTIFGRRENIMVIREKGGKREFGKVDLTSNNLFLSPYYYLEQGDVVYVEMNKDKLLLNDATEAKNYRLYSLVLAVISSVAIIITALHL